MSFLFYIFKNQNEFLFCKREMNLKWLVKGWLVKGSFEDGFAGAYNGEEIPAGRDKTEREFRYVKES